MAWKAPKPRTAPTKKNDSSFPGLKPAGPEASAKIEYDELQRDEIFALEAIYGDDFIQHGAAHSAWKKSEPSFDILIRASSDEDFVVTVGFTLTATYPKTPPLVTIKDLDGLREATQFKIQKFIEVQPRIFAKEEQEMVDKIVEGVRDILEDAAQAKASGKQLPSLEEERQRHELAVAKVAQEQKERDLLDKEEEMRQQEKATAQEIEQEIQRQKQRAKESKLSRRPAGMRQSQASDSASADLDQIDFDQFCTTTDRLGNTLTFRSVSGKSDPRIGQVSTVFTVRPILANGQGSQAMALKEIALRPGPGKDAKDFKKQLQLLESRIQSLKVDSKMHHRHIVDILDFKVESGIPEEPGLPNAWTVRILTPLAEKGSLEELLELAGQIEIGKVRAWTRDLLDALNFLHNKSITHQDVHLGNILLFREPTGEIIPKISDASYQREIHNLIAKKQDLPGLHSAKSAYWLPPEIAGASKPQYTAKTDIWDFGIVFVQMVFGLDALRKYSSPRNLMDSLPLSQPLHELVSRFFKEDNKKRPRAFELGARVSRYTEDFVEEGRLGKGGFGEVVKARKKLDGQIYAIKKITQRSQASLTEILKEVRLLSQLSHPAVVRYYNTWVEEVADVADSEGDTSVDDHTDDDTAVTESNEIDIQFATSTGGLDFMSSNAAIGFGYDEDDSDGENDSDEFESDSHDDDDDDDDDDDEDEDDEASSVIGPSEGDNQGRRRAMQKRPYRTILYISMEYCEKRTLRDLIARKLYTRTTEIWRLFRQVLEGLAHIHSLSIVHRDLKPENIFISSSTDGVDNVKIGDFGLATSGQSAVERTGGNNAEGDDMTRSIGTVYYAAPEVRSAANGSYSSKVDMYSLGIIFFEMCYMPMMGMQKADVITQLRLPKPVLPLDFKPAEKTQTEISGKLPVQMESETIRRTLAGLADPNSPYYRKMLSTFFDRPVEAAKNFAWDMPNTNVTSSAQLLSRSIVKDVLISIFRRHGALETTRTSIYPRSSHYADNVVQLLDSNGTVLQLPYDLTMGNARMLAKNSAGPMLQRTFTFGQVFRDKGDTGQPLMFGEVDFDIVTSDTLDLALKEAEVLKVLDEILIFEHCGIEPSSRRAAADVLSRLNIHSHTWQKIRMELRSPSVGLSATSVDELQRFDFRDSPNKAFSKLKAAFEGSDMYQRATPTIAHLKEVVEFAKRLGVSSKMYINPLNSLKENFYSGGILFSCMYDKKLKDVFAAGGRYDQLINEQRPKVGGQLEKRHAVGFSLAWERLSKTPKPGQFVKKADDDSGHALSGQRCDVLVASFDKAILRSSGIEVLSLLWAHDISAELAKDARSPEDLMLKHRDDSYSWIIIIKQDSMLKIKTMGKKDIPDTDLPMAQLLAWLRPEMRERDAKSSVKLLRSGAGEGSSSSQGDRDHQEQEVKVLVAQAKSKKFNRRTVVEQAQISASNLVKSFLDGPILAVETSEQVMDLIRETKLSDVESWRRVEHGVTTFEKKYVREMHDELDGWRFKREKKGGSRHSFLYNFRSGTCLYYDLAK
ncbi:Serine/threonine-protein kinase GCN2 [Escovopsis weberi]|uniref:non-specific serine/threonine protein kinase n=1 Tax=Escovopsis weberi TaxID=150374 RepID=A0A0M8N5V3_ESCWE|nr:Serine/threonine-protein kinase GCN2 [Escovopsis weberi]